MSLKKLIISIAIVVLPSHSYANSTVQSPSVCREILQIFSESGLDASDAVSLTFQLTNQARESKLEETLSLARDSEKVYSTDAILSHLIHRLFKDPIDRNFLSLSVDSLKFLPTFQKHQALLVVVSKEEDLTKHRLALVLPYLKSKDIKLYLLWAGLSPAPRLLTQEFDVVSLHGTINPCTRVLWRELKQRGQVKGKSLIQKK